MKALETMIQNMFHKDCAACTDQEVYEALLTYTKEQLAAKGYHDGKKKIYYILFILFFLSIFIFQRKMTHLIVLKIPAEFVDTVEILLHLPNNLL